MRFLLDIDYPAKRMEASRRRLEARASYEYADRVPVGFCVVPRYFAKALQIPYNALFSNVEEHYRLQLEFLKYRIENIPEDIVCAGPVVSVGPYFDNVLDSAAFGAEVVWPENETLHSMPTIHSVDEMNRFGIPEPGTGLWGQARDWWLRMRELTEDTRLTFAGREARVDMVPLGIGGLSPHMIAIDLVGHDFYWWQAEYPGECHRFLDKITAGLIAAQRYFMEIDPRPRGGFGIAEDTAQAMSADMFREFCVPYASRLYEELGGGAKFGRGMHMCGRSTHLHESLVEDLHISSFDVFGYLVPPEVAAANLGGKMLLWGNIDPMLMLNGSPEQVKQASLEALRAMAPCGGFMLGDGANVCPGTPLENLAALTEAAEEYGSPTSTQTRKSDRVL